MKRVVRFVEDGQPYVAGDFGDYGEETMDGILADDYIVLGMLTYDEDKITDLTTDTDLLESDALIDSVWCIVVDQSCIGNTGCDYTPDNVQGIRDQYLREMAVEALREPLLTVREVIMSLLDFPLDARVCGMDSDTSPSFALSEDGTVYAEVHRG